MPLAQAIFTSMRGPSRDGYQLAVASDGLSREDARAVSQWGPAHDALRDAGALAESFQFHPLPSGSYCLSRTTHQGPEYSGRGGPRVFTQSFVLSPEVLRRFANHPFRVFEALVASGRFATSETRPLEAFALPGTASVIRPNDLSRLQITPGPDTMLWLVERIGDSAPWAIVARQPVLLLLRGLLDLLPVARRLDFSFCTGLRDSPRRPFRLLLADQADPRECRQWQRAGRTVLDLADDNSDAELASREPTDPAHRQTHQLWRQGHWADLANLLDESYVRYKPKH